MNKLTILAILILSIISIFFIISKTIFTTIVLGITMIFLISKIGDIKMFNFLKHLGKSKGKQLGNETRKLAFRLDREGATDAVLGEMQEQLEEFGLELATARKRSAKETKEYVEVQKLYDQRLSAAESIKADVDAGDYSKEGSLLKLVELLESTAISVETEKSESEFWTSHLKTIQERYDKAALDLKSARSKISQGTAKMEQAEIIESQAKLKSEVMKRASGLASSMSSLDAALGALDDATMKAETRAEVANISLETFKSSTIEEEDEVIKAAMSEVSGESSSMSISDRLSKLK
jgi:hypothetical protein